MLNAGKMYLSAAPLFCMRLTPPKRELQSWWTEQWSSDSKQNRWTRKIHHLIIRIVQARSTIMREWTLGIAGQMRLQDRGYKTCVIGEFSTSTVHRRMFKTSNINTSSSTAIIRGRWWVPRNEYVARDFTRGEVDLAPLPGFTEWNEEQPWTLTRAGCWRWVG
jgi:hypothetical protein